VKVRKLEKHQAYLKNKFALAGREMKPWENQGQEYILFPKENVHEETSASDVYAQIVVAANNQRVNMWDMLFAFRDDDFTARKQIAEADLQAIHHRVVDPQEDRCLACKKSGLYGHVGGKQHQQSLQWHASCDALLGKTPAVRVFASGLPLGPDGELEEVELKRFWGRDVFNLGTIGTRILLEKGLFVKPRRSAPGFVVPGTNIAGASMAFVEFTCGQAGKYGRGGAHTLTVASPASRQVDASEGSNCHLVASRRGLIQDCPREGDRDVHGHADVGGAS
jgi:hypothetical protein